MEQSLRQKRVARLIEEALGRILIEDIQDAAAGLITVTRVEMTGDLRTARVFLSYIGRESPEAVLSLLENKKGLLRKSLASRVKLKYNPSIHFEVDPTPAYADRVERLIESLRKNDPESDS